MLASPVAITLPLGRGPNRDPGATFQPQTGEPQLGRKPDELLLTSADTDHMDSSAPFSISHKATVLQGKETTGGERSLELVGRVSLGVWGDT